MTVRISVDASQAIAKIKAYQISKIQGVKEIVNKTAASVNRKAKQKAPVDTGRLRSSIQMEAFKGGLAVEVGTNVKYAPYVEFGTRRMRAQPYLFPAWEEERRNYENKIKKELRSTR